MSSGEEDVREKKRRKTGWNIHSSLKGLAERRGDFLLCTSHFREGGSEEKGDRCAWGRKKLGVRGGNQRETYKCGEKGGERGEVETNLGFPARKWKEKKKQT